MKNLNMLQHNLALVLASYTCVFWVLFSHFVLKVVQCACTLIFYMFLYDQVTRIWMVLYESILNIWYWIHDNTNFSTCSNGILLSFRIKYKNMTSTLFFQMMEERTHLPVYQSHDHILQVIKNSPVTLIRGETGCGKTTQVICYPSLTP